MRSDSPRRVGVCGLGNVLMGDDALGPWVVALLRGEYEMPDRVRIVDLGTPGLDLTPHLADIDTLILIDTVSSDGAPGELRRYDREQILRHHAGPRLSPHDPGVKQALLTLELAETGPGEVLLLGVVPGRVDSRIGLTPEVREAATHVAGEVVRELERRGHTIPRRIPPDAPDTWWER